MTKTIRGLVVADYLRLQRRIKAGEITWQQAEKLGYCLAAAKRGRKPKPLKVIKQTKAKRATKSETKTATRCERKRLPVTD